jgi:hypothetical protein
MIPRKRRPQEVEVGAREPVEVVAEAA